MVGKGGGLPKPVQKTTRRFCLLEIASDYRRKYARSLIYFDPVCVKIMRPMVTVIAQIHCEPSLDAWADLQLMIELEILNCKSLHWSGQISAPTEPGGINISY